MVSVTGIVDECMGEMWWRMWVCVVVNGGVIGGDVSMGEECVVLMYIRDIWREEREL